MNKWKKLFHGEYANRRRILSGLALEQVSEIRFGQTHSLYAELWHTVLWQNLLLKPDEARHEEMWEAGVRFPQDSPVTLEEWETLVEEFLSGVNLALEWTTSPEKLALEVEPGETIADVLRGLAVHNAYHLGKIVAVRQMMGLWQV